MRCVGCGYPISEPLNEYGKRGFCGRVCYVLFEGWKGNPLKSCSHQMRITPSIV